MSTNLEYWIFKSNLYYTKADDYLSCPIRKSTFGAMWICHFMIWFDNRKLAKYENLLLQCYGFSIKICKPLINFVLYVLKLYSTTLMRTELGWTKNNGNDEHCYNGQCESSVLVISFVFQPMLLNKHDMFLLFLLFFKRNW